MTVLGTETPPTELTLTKLKAMNNKQIRVMKSQPIYSDGRFIGWLIIPQTGYLHNHCEQIARDSNSAISEKNRYIYEKWGEDDVPPERKD